MLGSGATLSQNLTAPPHSDYFYEFDFIQIDSWDSETAYAKIDNNVVWQNTYQGHTHQGGASQGSQICGNPTRNNTFEWLEYGESIQLTGAHTSSSISVQFETTINSSAQDESWVLIIFC